MEKDDEVKGIGNSLDFGERIHDPRLGRFLSVDPRWKEFADWSPYLFGANNPIRMVDEYGEGPGDRVKAARSMIGIAYQQETNSTLRTAKTPEALKYMDCAEFVSRVLAADKITPKVQHMNSGSIKALLDDKQKFVHSNSAKAGDVAVWDGHVGIVTGVDKDGKIKLTHARGNGKLSQENPYFITPQQYRSSTFYGYYRPIIENESAPARPSNPPSAQPSSSVATPSSSTSSSEESQMYFGGTLPDVVIAVDRTSCAPESNSGSTGTGSSTSSSQSGGSNSTPSSSNNEHRQ